PTPERPRASESQGALEQEDLPAVVCLVPEQVMQDPPHGELTLLAQLLVAPHAPGLELVILERPEDACGLAAHLVQALAEPAKVVRLDCRSSGLAEHVKAVIAALALGEGVSLDDLLHPEQLRLGNVDEKSPDG